MRKAYVVPTIVVAVLILAGVGALIYLKTAMHGFSARAAPSQGETILARFARAVAMPAAKKNMKNPVPLTSEVEQQALAHFADHCAVCHGNNGSGDTMFGRGLYPRPPDLRSAYTQSRTDEEIFYVIENGIRMSGMPAFGAPDSAEDSWKLVHFIRHLPKLTTPELEEMERLNPRGPVERKEEDEENQFLNGSSSQPATRNQRIKEQPITGPHGKGHEQ